MKIRYNIAQGSYQLSRLTIDLSKEAQVRLSWFDYYRNHQHNARLTCRHFGISPQTFYHWQKRYDPHHRKTLETRSCRPKRVRQPTYTLAQIEAVRKVRECYPHGSKDKLAVVNFNRYSKRNAKKRKSKLFVLPPRSLQLNGTVKRANRTHAEEFYEVIDSTFDLADIRPELLQ